MDIRRKPPEEHFELTLAAWRAMNLAPATSVFQHVKVDDALKFKMG